MIRNRIVLSLAAAIVGLAVATGLGVLVLSPARAAVGPLPAEGLVLPADARFLMGVDVKRLAASPLYAHFKGTAGLGSTALTALEERTGLSPERDVRELVVAGGLSGGKEAIALALGDFDPARIGRAIETGKKATSRKVGGANVYVFSQGPRPTALTFLGDHAILFGPAAPVEAAIEGRAQAKPALKANPVLMQLLEGVKPGSTFWMVGDQSLLAGVPTGSKGSGDSAANVTLPKLETIALTGDLDPLLSVDVVGGATDAAAATSLADVVRGFVALATLQAAQKPELRGLQSAITVTTEGSHVRVAGRFPHELVVALSKQQSSRPPAPTTPAPPSTLR